MLVARHDWVALHETMGCDLRAILIALFVLNRTYIHDVGLKWIDQHIAEIALCPQRCPRVFRILYRGPRSSLQALQASSARPSSS